ncbi:MAG: VWA domain-containing protein [Lentisphaeria bacterium]
MIIHFETPWALLTILLPLFLFLWKIWRKHTRVALGFSSLHNAKKVQKSLRQRLLWIPSLCLFLAWAFLCIALARPQTGRERVRDASKGIAIEMVLDRSGSMSQEMEYQSQRMNRLDAVKRVFTSFIYGSKQIGLKGRPNDLIGMVSFARYADTICPLTLEHGILKPFLDSVKIVKLRSEDGTAIGDALALAAARLQTAEKTLAKQTQKNPDAYKIQSKVIILLTDGINNCGKRDIQEATELAKKWGIKVYAIAVGGGENVNVISTIFGNYKVAGNAQDIETTPLKNLAKETGGLFRMATDSKSLISVYREIDELEKSEVETMRFVDYKEVFLHFAAVALILLTLYILLNATIFRRIP